MKIISIEPTPSPNTMKLNMDYVMPNGQKIEITHTSKGSAPAYAAELIEIEGVKSIFQAADFIAIERFPKGDWQHILSRASELLGEGAGKANPVEASNLTFQEAFGEVNVFVQFFRGMPMQIKLVAGGTEKRVALPQRFMDAALKAQSVSPNLVMERQWIEQGVRYGEMEEIGEQVMKEIEAAYDEESLNRLVENILKDEVETTRTEETVSKEQIIEQLDDDDWQKRFAALTKLKPSAENIPLFVKALDDKHVSIRRFAVAYLGMVEEGDVLPFLYKALKDPSFAVRRTAGDAISDKGDPAAIGEMVQMLQDPNKLVRWRAARFMYEVGDETAIPALEEAQHDPEFEVSMQAKIALERIRGGKEAEGTVWQQITKSRAESKQ